ncbi:protein kinase [Georgenia sp. AZ-5]|uniref:serine/threonine-protein kinase n=1 Tax=Georgenia sp. AZ-5 TaxID=3367526 RepID=UPI00375446D9
MTAGGEQREVGGYRLLRRLGSGGMGAVFEAVDADGRRVALKLLHPHIGSDPQARRRLAREVALLHRVKDAGVARVLDAEVEDAEAFVVTELIEGPTLEEDVAADGPFSPQELSTLAHSLADALRAIHAVGVIHRDLKPGNVMMSEHGPVVIDFGIAQVADDARLTQTGLVTGTPGYLDPDVIAGAEPSPVCDWWSWAAVLVFAATGRPPFGRGPTAAVLARVATGQVDTDGLDPVVARALSAALEPGPGNRLDPEGVLAVLDGQWGDAKLTQVLTASAAAAASAASSQGGPGEREAGEREAGAGATAATAPFTDGTRAAAGADGTRPVVAGSAADDARTVGDGAAHGPMTRGLPHAPDAAHDPVTHAVPPARDDTYNSGTRAQRGGGPATRALPADPRGAAEPATRVVPHEPATRALPVEGTRALPPVSYPPAGRDLAPTPHGRTPAHPDPYTPPGAYGGHPGQPYPGEPGQPGYPYDPYDRPPAWARPARRRTLVVATVGLAVTAIAAALPGVFVLAVAGLLVLTATVGWAGRARRASRLRRGVRKGDDARMLAGLPWHLLRGVLGALPGAIAGALAGAAAWWAATAAADPRLTEPVVLWVAGAAALLVAWLLPTSRASRDGARAMIDVLTPTRGFRTLLVVLLLAVVAVVAAQTLLGSPPVPSWAPLPDPAALLP